MRFPSDILDRVRKLLALAGSPNVHEAAAAAARAQALISRHRLEAWLEAQERLDAHPITDGRDEPLEVARKPRKWKRVLAAALARANGCEAWVDVRGKEQAICVIGRQEDRDAVRALWDALVKRVEWLSATEGEGQPREWHEAFRIGVVAAIGEELQVSAGEVRAELSEAALVRVDPRAAAHQEALDRYVAERFGEGRGRSIRVDAQAFQEGRAAGVGLAGKLRTG